MRIGDFLLHTVVLIELFSLGRTAEALRAIIGSKSEISLQREPADPKFQVEGVAPTNHSSSRKTRQIFFRFVSMHALDRHTDRRADRRTDRILIARPRLHSTQRGKNYGL